MSMIADVCRMFVLEHLCSMQFKCGCCFGGRDGGGGGGSGYEGQGWGWGGVGGGLSFFLMECNVMMTCTVTI